MSREGGSGSGLLPLQVDRLVRNGWRHAWLAALWGLILTCFPGYLSGQHPGLSGGLQQGTRILFVLDASASMADRWQSDTKYAMAVRVLGSILDTLEESGNLETGLRVYGPKRNQVPDCQASYLMVPLGVSQAASIKRLLDQVKPTGTTPIAYSLEQAAGDFSSCDTCRNILILITDGLEACDGDPCAVSLSLQQKGIFLRPFIVGIGRNMADSLGCMGVYYDASAEGDLREVLSTVVATATRPSTLQIALLDQYGQPAETDVHILLKDRMTGKPRYSFIHTLDASGRPDTLFADPLIFYDMVIQTIPPIRKDSIQLVPGGHQVVSLPAAQGTLEFRSDDGSVHQAIIRMQGTMQAIHVQPTNLPERYLAGSYDVTVLTTPRINFQQVGIESGRITRLTIPVAGKAVIRPREEVTGCLYMLTGTTQLWVSNLTSGSGPAELGLQPGEYLIEYRPLNAVRTEDSRRKQFRVNPAEAIDVIL